jgi:hypothetical protein
MADSTGRSPFLSFWTKLPGLLTALAMLLTALTGLYVAMRKEPMPAPATAPVSSAWTSPLEFRPPIVAVSGRDYRLDWCLRWNDQCGGPAAKIFCQSKGFLEEDEFKIEQNVGPTWVLGSKEVCEAGHCDGFAFIKCRK